MTNPISIKIDLDKSAMERPGFFSVGGFKGNILAVIWDKDTGHSYKWNGEWVTEAAVFANLRLADV